MSTTRVVIVDVETPGLWSLAARLRAEHAQVSEVSDTAAALESLGRGVDALIVHMGASVDVATVVGRARDVDPDLWVVALGDGAAPSSASGPLATAEFVRLPIDLTGMTRRIMREAAAARQRRRLHALQTVAGVRLQADALVGDSAGIALVRTAIRKLGSTPGVATLIRGERGSGRGFVARILHDTGERHDGPFVRIDCTRARQTTLAAELFGAEDVAASGRGAVAGADEGTLVLENVERLQPDLQIALLRLLEEQVFRRVGSTVDRAADVRIVAVTGADLEAAVREGRFRPDLFYRLEVMRIDVPPLRRRGHDIVQLASLFARREADRRGSSPVTIDDEADALLLAHPWPGNVRELRCVIERAVMLSEADVLGRRDLAVIDPAVGSGPFTLPEAGLNLEDLERQLVVAALARTGGNQTHAAALLGMHRDQIRYRMVKYGLRR